MTSHETLQLGTDMEEPESEAKSKLHQTLESALQSEPDFQDTTAYMTWATDVIKMRLNALVGAKEITPANSAQAKLLLGSLEDIEAAGYMPDTAPWHTWILEAIAFLRNHRQTAGALSNPADEFTPQAFSEVGSVQANRLLADLCITGCHGNLLDPVLVTDLTPTPTPFERLEHPTQSIDTPKLLKHHQTELEKFGIKFGRGAFKMYDLSEEGDLYHFQYKGQEYIGGVDGGIAPYGLYPSSAAFALRVAYLHKESRNHPQSHQGNCGASSQGIAVGGESKVNEAHEGQSIMTILGAYAHSHFPLLLDLTNGDTHHILMIRDDELLIWEGLTPQQAYLKQSQVLSSMEQLANRVLRMADLPEELQQPLKTLRKLQIESGLRQQLDSIVPDLPPEERVGAAFELISAWSHSVPTGKPTKKPTGLAAVLDNFYNS